MRSIFWYALAALGEIAGCYAFWMWLRLQRPSWLVFPGIVALLIFAWALTKVEAIHAGRAYAAYAAIYLVGALAWMRFVEGATPDRWDLGGGAVALLGCSIIFFGPRA
jgi:small multidrug resistance family-3 protein